MNTTNYLALNGMLYLGVLAHASWRGARQIRASLLYIGLLATTLIYLAT